jgi:hypothetical protein
MMFKLTLLMHLAGAAGWATCDFPTIDWIAVDGGDGKSATQKVTTLGTTTFIGGYAGGETILMSSSNTTTVTNTETDWISPCSAYSGCTQTGEMDMHISRIGDNGAPEAIFIFEGKGLGSSPGWGMMHGMEDGIHLALSTSVAGNLTLPSGPIIENKGAAGYTGLVIKMKGDGTIPWHKAFESAAGSSVTSVDGDYEGNMFVNYQTCVPCTENCEPGYDGYGRPTGQNAPTCTRYLEKLNSADGSTAWSKQIPTAFNPGHIRLQRTGGAATNLYGWGSAEGTDVTIDACTMTSPDDGSSSTAVLFQINATSGAVNWCSAPAGTAVAVSRGYMDISSSTSNPVIAVQGSFSGTVTFGSTTLTASFGYYTSFVARVSTTDGSVVWAEQTPMSRGIQVTPDGAYVGVFCQTTGTTDSVQLTDTGGSTTTIRSRGSWDLIAMKLDASDGTGIYAIDGGGDSMEYFHGFGMNSDGDMLISGYSRSSTFHFGDHSMENLQSTANGGAGDNKIFTIQVSAESSTPSCITSCASNTPVIASGTCFIDNYCYANGAHAPYPARSCFNCDPAASTTDWTGPNLTESCFISDSCYAAGDAKPGSSSRSPASTCLACLPAKGTDDWTVRDYFDLSTSGTCVSLATVETTTTDALTTAMSASTMVKSITGANGLGTSFEAAKELYVGSVLQDLAKKSWSGEYYAMSVAYFGSATFLDDYILSALDGTGQFAGTLAEERGDMSAARTEAVKKALQDQILVMATISSVETDPTDESNWDLAFAYYYGDTPSGAPWARANKRGKNYGTMAADGITAKFNFHVMDAIAAGKVACTANTTSGGADSVMVAAAWTQLTGSVLGIYAQAALRYSYLLDADIAAAAATADHQGEGGAFWRVIEPLMASRDSALSEYVTAFYTMTNAPTGTGNRYCPLKHLLDHNIPEGMDETAFGYLEAASAVSCLNGIQLPELDTIDDDLYAAMTTAHGISGEVLYITGYDGLKANFSSAKTLYLGSNIRTLATTGFPCPGTTCYFSTAAAYFGSETFLDDYIMSALDGTGQFAETLAEERGEMSAARTEAVKKGLQDQIAFAAALNALNDPTSTASWYKFYVYWTGGSPKGAPWARANKRCKNYGTCGGDTVGADGEIAQVNSNILLATLWALSDVSTNGAAAASIAMSNAMIVYYQAALRYAYLLDADITAGTASADHQGEGGAFWRVIAPVMASLDAVTSQYVSDFYNMATVPTGTDRYCPLANMLMANLPGGRRLSDNATETADDSNATSTTTTTAPTAAVTAMMTPAVGSMGTLQGSSITLPDCPTPVGADTEGAQVTTMTVVAPGVPSDYDATKIAAETAGSLGISPTSVSVAITATATATRLRRLSESTATVDIDISVYSADADAAAAMETELTTLIGTAASASTFLSAALDKEITISAEPAAPSSGAAAEPAATEAEEDAGDGSGGGLSTGALVGIIVGVALAAIVVVGGIAMLMMKKKNRVKVVNAS